MIERKVIIFGHVTIKNHFLERNRYIDTCAISYIERIKKKDTIERSEDIICDRIL